MVALETGPASVIGFGARCAARLGARPAKLPRGSGPARWDGASGWRRLVWGVGASVRRAAHSARGRHTGRNAQAPRAGRTCRSRRNGCYAARAARRDYGVCAARHGLPEAVGHAGPDPPPAWGGAVTVGVVPRCRNRGQAPGFGDSGAADARPVRARRPAALGYAGSGFGWNVCQTDCCALLGGLLSEGWPSGSAVPRWLVPRRRPRRNRDAESSAVSRRCR